MFGSREGELEKKRQSTVFVQFVVVDFAAAAVASASCRPPVSFSINVH